MSGFFMRLILLFLVTIFVFSISNAEDVEVFSDTQLELVEEIQAAIFNEDFNYALEIVDSLIQVEPGEPLWVTFQSAVYVAWMTYEEEDFYKEEIERNHKLVDSLVNVRSESFDDTRKSWDQLCLGHMHAYKALREGRFGSSFDAMKLGLKARNAYTKGLEFDSENYDLYGGLGMYHYWKSAKSGLLRDIGIFNDDRDEGIDELYLALDNSLFSSATAHNALLWIWFDKEEYDSVLTIAQSLYDFYPEGLTFIWPMAEANFEIENYRAALELYSFIRERLLSNPGNYYNLVETDYMILLCLDDEVESEFRDDILSNFSEYYEEIGKEVKDRQKDKINYLKDRLKDY